MTEAKKRELLKQFVDGSITPTNRHLLEREALDDPFLFEALEGYATISQVKAQGTKQQRKTERPQIFTFISMAASFLILVGVVFAFKHFNQTDGPTEFIAMNTEAAQNVEADVVEVSAKSSLKNAIPEPNDTQVADREAASLVSTDQLGASQIDRKLFNQQELKAKAKMADSDYSSDFPRRPPLSRTTARVAYEEDGAKEVIVSMADFKDEELIDDAVVDSETKGGYEVITEEVPPEAVQPESEIETAALPTGIAEDLRQATSSKQDGESTSKAEDAKVFSSKSAQASGSVNNLQDDRNKESDHSRKSFPVGGMEKFYEYLEENPLHKDCSTAPITLKFQIRADGTLNDVEIVDDSALSSLQPESYLSCIKEIKDLLINYGPWQTKPLNRQIRRMWTYHPPKK